MSDSLAALTIASISKVVISPAHMDTDWFSDGLELNGPKPASVYLFNLFLSTLTESSKSQNLEDSVKVDRNKLNKYTEAGFGPFSSNPSLNQSVSMWAGDITTLEIDAIVNAANESLMGGGGVDGAIHRAAGPQLKAECATLHGCPTGQAKITGGYKLPAKYIIHTVGPRGEKPDLLKSCYQNCLEILRKENLRSIAFPCISTGIYGYPQENAAKVALTTVRKFMDQHPDSIERVIFCLFLKEDIEIYSRLMQVAFPAQ
uniref:Macro domain-containing protein n=1 Tax=Homalodisca liturata TaxID=320908 RepID=A0A1B6JN87_9HEMI